MKLKKLLLSSLALSIVAISGITFKSETVEAWSADNGSVYEHTENTHLWIVDGGLGILSRNPETRFIYDYIMVHPNWNRMAKGLYDADHVFEFKKTMWAQHFYDPYKGRTFGLASAFGAESAKVKGQTYFDKSIECYKDNNLADAMYYFGVSLHYFTDISQPMHANNFTAVDSPVGYHVKYEQYTDWIKKDSALETSEYITLDGETAGDWVHENALRAYPHFQPLIDAYNNHEGELWKEIVTEPTLERLRDSQKTVAGYVKFWFDSLQK